MQEWKAKLQDKKEGLGDDDDDKYGHSSMLSADEDDGEDDEGTTQTEKPKGSGKGKRSPVQSNSKLKKFVKELEISVLDM